MGREISVILDTFVCQTKHHFFSARLLDDAERRITESIIRADAKNGVIQNVVKKQNGLALTDIIVIICQNQHQQSKGLIV